MRYFLLVFLFQIHFSYAQNEKEVLKFFKHKTNTLCSPSYEGRGYVGKGKERAARFIANFFSEIKLLPAAADSSFYQNYDFPINSFPNQVNLKVNKKDLQPGIDFIIDASSPSTLVEKIKIKHLDLEKIKDSSQFEEKLKTLNTAKYFYKLTGIDSICKRLNYKKRELIKKLPKGNFMILEKGKMNWTVSSTVNAASLFYVQDSVLPKHLHKASFEIDNKFYSNYKNQNILGKINGTLYPDSFIVFTAHYDHLGMMGRKALFPGASDNASGVAMMLYLAQYFSTHPQKYAMLFIAFSGEEAGLLGSKYFTEHPSISLSQIKFLINTDIMGDASNGVTVVNATEYPNEFSRLQTINKNRGYLTEIKSRGKAANSDHYWFSEKGVPSFFMYSNGGKGFYHDVFDVPQSLSFDHVPQVAQLLIDFAKM